MSLKRIVLLLATIFTAYSCSVFNQSDVQKRTVKGCLTHIVNVDEDLTDLLVRYEVSVADLKPHNPDIEYELQPGDYVYIPKKVIGSRDVSDVRKEVDMLQEMQQDKQNEQEAEEQESETSESVMVYKEHIVASGETFYSISRMYGITVAEIQSHNEDVVQNAMSIGTVLKIPSHTTVVKKEEVGAPASFDKPSIPDADEHSFYNSNYEPISFDNGATGALNVSLLLPLIDTQGEQSVNFVQFYQGFLVGLDSLRNEGVNISLNVINTDKESVVADNIINTKALDGSDIIIGPVYDEQFCKVSEYASYHSIPIISPLAKVSCGDDFVFQVAPDDATKYEKLRELVEGRNVIYFSTNSDDKEFIDAMRVICGDSITTIPFNIKAAPDSYADKLSTRKENVFLIAPTTMQLADAVISKVGAIKMFAGASVVKSIATPRIARMTGLDPSMFYSADLSYITSYHYDRTNKKVRTFDKEYMEFFGELPTLYSYRGYDVALFFVGSLKEFGKDLRDSLDDYSISTLQVAYRFTPEGRDGKYINREWARVSYTPSYEIIVE